MIFVVVFFVNNDSVIQFVDATNHVWNWTHVFFRGEWRDGSICWNKYLKKLLVFWEGTPQRYRVFLEEVKPTILRSNRDSRLSGKNDVEV